MIGKESYNAKFISWLKHRLQQPLPGVQAQVNMASAYRKVTNPVPGHARQSGVLIALFPEHNDTNLIIIERTQDGGVHSGQLAFPGGKQEEDDKDIIATALREANEEVGIVCDDVIILGRLTELYIPVSNFVIHPVVGFCNAAPSFIPSDDEVSSIMVYPLREVFANKGAQTARVFYNNIEMKIETQAYNLPNGKYIWGATAMILSEFEKIWEEFLQFENKAHSHLS